ncbi:MAG: quinol:cytochrome C oxidoreductase [Candidatus Kryptoniota bacterium]
MSKNEHIDMKKLKSVPSSFSSVGWTLLIFGVVLMAVSFAIDQKHASFSLIMTLAYVATIGTGALFWVGVEYVSSAVWSTALRRPFEFMAGVIPFLIILAIPLLFNLHTIFYWTHKSLLALDPTMLIRAPYLNVPFFIIRTVIVLAVWWLFYYLMVRNSNLQDTTGDQRLTKKNVKLSAGYMPVFALTLTLFSVDWLMSLAPGWYSTIFAVYVFAGAAIGAMAFGTLLIVLLNEKNRFPVKLTGDHYYNLGALMFAFINFWAYMAFSQFMLQWYGNLKDETSWYIPRMHGSWAAVSIVLVLGELLVPFFLLVSRSAKMNPRRLVFVSIWLLAAHAVDIYWLTMPEYNSSAAVFGLGELAFLVLSAGIVMSVFSWKARSNNMVPVGDPKLERGLEFHL